MARYAYPILGSKPVDEINQEDVLAVLKPIWLEKPETASRVRQRIEYVDGTERVELILFAAPEHNH